MKTVNKTILTKIFLIALLFITIPLFISCGKNDKSNGDDDLYSCNFSASGLSFEGIGTLEKAEDTTFTSTAGYLYTLSYEGDVIFYVDSNVDLSDKITENSKIHLTFYIFNYWCDELTIKVNDGEFEPLEMQEYGDDYYKAEYNFEIVMNTTIFIEGFY